MLRWRLLFLFLVAVIGFSSRGQSVISGHSGLILFSEGTVLIDGAALARQAGRFSELNEGSTLSTENGRVEILLSPAVLLRIDGNSAVQMIQNSLSDTQLMFLKGSAIVESTEPNPDSSVTMIFQDRQLRLPREGSYRIDFEPAQLKVTAGEVEIASGAAKTVVGVASRLAFTTGTISEHISYHPDAFDHWSKERSKIDRIAAAQKPDGSVQNGRSKRAPARLFPRLHPPIAARTW